MESENLDTETGYSLIAKMREADCDVRQLETLCLMHLSFEIDMQDVDSISQIDDPKALHHKLKGWNRFTRKFKHNVDENDSTQTLTHTKIAAFRVLVEYLKKEFNINQEGIFRKSGLISRQNALKETLGKGVDPTTINLELYTAHDCASVLKTMLSELNEPLITMRYYNVFYKVAG